MRRSRLFSDGKYRSRYTFAPKRHRHPVLVVLGIVAAAALLFVGYSIQKPLMALIQGHYTASAASSAASSPASKGASAASSAAASSATSSASSTAVRGLYLPASALAGGDALNQAISSMQSAGLNTAVLNLKGEDGVVRYASKIAEVQGTSIVASGAPDGSAAAQTLAQHNITPAAEISCFKDPVGAEAMRDAAIKYSGNHSMSWLDPTNRWLNPYSDKAQQYIIDLATEAVSLGYKQIYLTNLQFPTGDTKAYYGDDLSSKEDCLKSFVAKAAQAVEAAGGKLSVVMPGESAVGQGSAQQGQDQNLYGFTADYYSPNLSPSLFPKGLTIGTTAVSDADPAAAVTAAAQSLAQLPSAKVGSTVPFIQAYAGSRPYTADDINAQISALSSAGIPNYILYAPTGTYSLSGVKAQ